MDPEVAQSPPEKWNVCERKYGHVYSGGRTGPLRDGYATCRLCGAHENEKAITEPCPENPLLADWERRGEAEAKVLAVVEDIAPAARDDGSLPDDQLVPQYLMARRIRAALDGGKP